MRPAHRDSPSQVLPTKLGPLNGHGNRRLVTKKSCHSRHFRLARVNENIRCRRQSAFVSAAGRIILWLRRGRLMIKSLADRLDARATLTSTAIGQRRPRRGAVASTA